MVPASHNHNIGSFIRSDSRHYLIEVFRDDFFRVGKTFAIGIALAVVDYMHVETRSLCSLVQTERHMAGAENVERCWRQHRLNENVQRPAADQAGVVLRILVQIESQCPRLLALDYLACRLPDVRLDTTATDRSKD